jgi:amino-acid N-acetyltransferase
MSRHVIRRAQSSDFTQITQLLESDALPLDGVPHHLDNFLVADLDGKVVGTIGLEIYGENALLRSAVVTPSNRNRGLGTLLYNALLEYAKKRGVKRLVLLTNTAEEYFRRKGFVRIDRASLTGPVTTSAEFTGACPSSAVCMELTLQYEH